MVPPRTALQGLGAGSGMGLVSCLRALRRLGFLQSKLAERPHLLMKQVSPHMKHSQKSMWKPPSLGQSQPWGGVTQLQGPQRMHQGRSYSSFLQN